ncbi:MAG: hypothetical protein QNI98_07060 [Woeseiaceae bacterium]|nr:hypothetical protein [Woeseiaceae bacterium]
MTFARMLVVIALVLLGTAANDAHAQGYSALSVDVYYYGGDESIPAGQPGRFKVTISNGGPDISTNTRVWFAWFRSGLSAASSQIYDARPSQGMCSPSYTPDPDCYLQMIDVGSQATIEFAGQTEPGRLGWYTLRVWVESDQAAKTMLAEYSKGSSVTIAESGGGSIGWVFLALIFLAGLNRRLGQGG